MNYSFGNGKHITYENGDLGDGLFIVLTALIEMNDWNVDNSHYHSLSICTIGHGFIVYYSKCTIHSCTIICNIAGFRTLFFLGALWLPGACSPRVGR